MKFFIKTFGCRVNQVESQALRENFLRHGFEPADSPEEADICVLNTCTVTHQADKDVEKQIRQILRRHPSARLVLTGCYARAQRARAAALFPQAELVGKYQLGRVLFNQEDLCWTVSGHEGHSRAFVKIQDGCDCFCSYCIVPFARPDKRSKPLADALKEVSALVQKGFAEVVLTGINIGNYSCPDTGADLAALCQRLAALEGRFRIRFSSIELQTVSEEIVDCMAARPDRFCNYFHLPLQAGCDKVLKDMNRHYDTSAYRAKVEELRRKVPGISIFADVIAGFPTETEADFKTTFEFIKEMGLAGLHVFSYSPRPGTRAAAFKQLAPAEIKRRADELRELDKQLRAEFAASLLGTRQEVFIEQCREGSPAGVTSNFQQVVLPEAPSQTSGLVQVKITQALPEYCVAELV